ncbi:alpha-ketoacid dehydrogenase subunit alpha/beta [Loktanella sp. Alg231-35]|uniref:alpha-ketoacid dehydrogenase subunit alpha/beta n=1 Tax=Loktanella sp. Alg231-35 TaxID=1922220 RepID=UPI000D557948|nr:alpha-ketoacid dehydrogenase subunit alpha/beta [Loktanella sp. Alg231-35]
MNSSANKITPLASQDFAAAQDMLEEIAFIRGFEAKALALTQTNPPRVPGSMHFCAGQEAVPVGAAAALRPDDQMIATYRGHGWAIASGLAPEAVMAEVCQKAGGVNGGRAGSAYLMAPDTRFVGENSIVGAGTTMACGVAMANLRKGNGQVVTVTIGDGAMNQGAVHEAMAFASAFKLPVIFVVENNGWAELTPMSKMVTVDRIAQRAGGYGMKSATINGSDAISVRDTFAATAEYVRSGQGPVLVEFIVPRLWGHYNKDIEHYRPKADRAEAETRDPIKVLGARLVAAGAMKQAQVDELVAAQSQRADDMAEAVMEGPDPEDAGILANVLAPPSAEMPEVLETQEMTYIAAVTLAMRAELETDENTLVYGEDVGNAGGIFGGSRYLQRDFGEDRVFDMPIAENAILGSAVGAAISGMRPIVEIMWADFIFVALDQLINQAANVRYITGGKSTCPMVVRTQQGVTPGSCAQHSQSIEAILAHIPGIKVALAASATDAYALLRAAAADPDPVVVIEARGLYFEKSEVAITQGAEPVGKARLRRDGKDVVIMTWGTMVPRALAAADALSGDGIEASVLDLRWLNPLDEDAMIAAAKAAGGNVLIVHEAVRQGGFAGEIAFRLRELVEPKTPLNIARVTTPDVRMPANAGLQSVLIPDAEKICTAAHALLKGK